jgi:aryl-alcohol dehydrogenase-like predicted oxidoreductase
MTPVPELSSDSGATPEGTARYRERFSDTAAEGHFRLRHDLRLSSIGIGTYLGNWDETIDDRYARSIVRAVELGVNVIDTAANYRFQRSERSIGKALGILMRERGFERDELIVCTKGGYIPFDGAPPRNVRGYIEETFVRTGIAELSDLAGGSHCMTPRYLRSQIDQSLRNMGLSCLDVYYIHNPESQLGEVSQDEFEKRLRAAFDELERNVAEGRIKNYGVATWNGFRAAPDEKNYHSLERMLGIAREAGGDGHGFRFVQLPFNLKMTEALTSENQPLGSERVSLLQAAADMGVTVMASASILQGKLSRGLPVALREPLGSLPSDAQTGIQFVRSAPGITTALIGMSQVRHVEENLNLVRVPPSTPEDFQRLFEGA